MRKKIARPLISFGGYQRWNSYWWRDLGRWLTQGWLRDLKWFLHRGRYGWAGRDVWDADSYIYGVLGAMLVRLSETTHSAPGGYPDKDSPRDWDTKTDFAQWQSDLTRWGETLLLTQEETTDWKEEIKRDEAAAKVMQELLPWWGALWN